MRRTIAILAAALAFSCATAPQPSTPPGRTLKYTWIRSGDVAGHAVTTIKADGERDYQYDYVDRGRGPNIQGVVRYDDRLVPVHLENKGNDYLKNKVTEEFSIENGTAKWSSAVEHGSAPAITPAFFLSMYGPPEEVGNLVRAALRMKVPCLALYPAGRSCVGHVADTTVDGQKIDLYSVTGLDFDPVYVWMGPDGEFFGSVSSWFSEIREGSEKHITELVKLQDDVAAGRLMALARNLRHHPVGTLLIRNARLFDPATLTVRDGMSVLADGHRIVRVAPDGQMQVSAGETIDAKGRFLMPGLWDMHVHFDPSQGIRDLAAGITTGRDMGNDFDSIVRARKDIDDGDLLGPRLLISGFMDGSGQYRAPAGEVVDTEQQARTAIDKFAAAGFVQVKVYSSMKPELVPFITQYAHSKGMRVCGHVPAGLFADDVVRIGWDEIQHINMLFLNFYRDVLNTQTPARFTTVADRGAALDVDSPEVRQFIARLHDKHIVIDETLGAFEGMFTARPGEIDPGFTAMADRLPPNVRRGLLTGGLPAEGDAIERHRASYQRMIDFVNRLYRAGVTLVPGTDSVYGFSLHREFELLVKAGVPPAEVLRMATLGDATVLHRDNDFGTIAAGKFADMILVDGDPAADISQIRRVVMTIKDGDVYDTARLYDAVGVQP